MACLKMWIVGASKFLVEFYALWYTRAMDRVVLFYDCNDAALAPIYPSYSPPWVCMVKKGQKRRWRGLPWRSKAASRRLTIPSVSISIGEDVLH